MFVVILKLGKQKETQICMTCYIKDRHLSTKKLHCN